jgi:hypothetical protein
MARIPYQTMDPGQQLYLLFRRRHGEAPKHKLLAGVLELLPPHPFAGRGGEVEGATAKTGQLKHLAQKEIEATDSLGLPLGIQAENSPPLPRASSIASPPLTQVP